MITLADIREWSIAEAIHALQQAAYTVEARLIGGADFPPLRETVDALRQSTDCFLVFVEQGDVLDCLSCERAGRVTTITRLLVSPAHFRRGIATALLRALDSRLPAGSTVRVMAADLNEPAIRAYEKLGYRTESSVLSPEGIALRRLHKTVDGHDANEGSGF